MVLGDRRRERIDRLHHVVVRLAHAGAAVQPLHHSDRRPEQRHDEAGIAAAGAEADGLAFEDGDVEGRIGGFQMVGGGKAGISGADDGDIDGDITGQRRRDRPRLLAAVPEVVRARMRLGSHLIARGSG